MVFCFFVQTRKMLTINKKIIKFTFNERNKIKHRIKNRKKTEISRIFRYDFKILTEFKVTKTEVAMGEIKFVFFSSLKLQRKFFFRFCLRAAWRPISGSLSVFSSLKILGILRPIAFSLLFSVKHSTKLIVLSSCLPHHAAVDCLYLFLVYEKISFCL